MQRIGYILRSYPRLSQTFILNEILALEQGRLAILSEHIRAAASGPLRYLRALRYVMRRTDLDEGYTAASRYECFLQAVYLTRLLARERRAGRSIDHVHAHFAHDPTLIAVLVQMLCGISFSFTAHARDLVEIPQRALIERIERATVMLTCSRTNIDYVNEVVPEPLRAKVRLIHHGVNLDSFHPALSSTRGGGEDLAPLPPRSGKGLGDGGAPLILSVGRLVEKKGFPDLIAACAQLKQAGHRFSCTIYGEGPLRVKLSALIELLDAADCVTLAGERSQQELIPIFQRAELFALAPFVADDGDRDGIPNVLVEAMACGLPVVSTAVAGIPELVRHDENGLLAPRRDVPALAGALAALLGDRERRARMGDAARKTAVEHFDLRAAAREIAALFDKACQVHTQTRPSCHPQTERCRFVALVKRPREWLQMLPELLAEARRLVR